jgi:hypothetical protein
MTGAARSTSYPVSPARPTALTDKRGIWATILAISEAAILGVLLYRIGWVRTNATADYYGVNTGLLDLSVTEYVQRSINSALQPALVLLLGTFAMLRVHQLIRRELARPPHRQHRIVRQTLRSATPVGICLLAGGSMLLLAGHIRTWPTAIAGPLAIFLGAAVIGYRRALIPAVAPLGDTSERLATLVLVGLGLMGFVLVTEQYANHVGRTIAANDAATLRSQPEILLHSTKKLDIAGGGVSLSYDPSPDQYFHYRYRGLRELIPTHGLHILAPADWGRTSWTVFTIRESASTRIDIINAPPP